MKALLGSVATVLGALAGVCALLIPLYGGLILILASLGQAVDTSPMLFWAGMMIFLGTLWGVASVVAECLS